MTNTYAINTTKRREFEVAEDLQALGLHPWVPRRLACRYVKEKREVVFWDRAYVPKLVFCVIPAISWRSVVDIKHVIGKPLRLSRLDIDGMPATRGRPARPGLKDFKEAVEAEYTDMERRRLNSEYRCEFTPGQALELLDVAFEGMPATFRAVVKHAHDDFARLQVETELFGRTTSMLVDPDKVKAQG